MPIRLVVRRVILVALIIGFAWASEAVASSASSCSESTLFPDFKCPDRSARPENAFNPMGMPFLFEDPYITTGLNFAYVYHRLPEGPAFEGGEAQVLALQIRAAITEKLGFIATKDGLTFLRPGTGAAVAEDTGIFDMTVGFKYALFESEENNFILSPAIRYEIPLGSKKLFQRNGDGVIIPSASFRWGLGKLGLDGANIIGGLGGQIPVDSASGSQSLFYNLHLDYGIKVENSVVKYIVPFIELNGIHYTEGGDGTKPVYLSPLYGGSTITITAAQLALGTGPFEAGDVANLGSTGVAGQDIVVLGGGIRIPTEWDISFGLLYEGPITSTQGIHDQRFTFMATWEL